MKIFLTTDTHFGHKRLIDWGRPEGFEREIIKNLRNEVSPGDLLIHLGDFCIGDDVIHHEWYFNLLPEIKHVLVTGNHDNKSSNWYLEHGWNFVCDSFVLRLFGKNVEFSHVPMQKRDGIDMNIHGHLHGNDHRKLESTKFYDEEFHKQIAQELSMYKPVEITQKLIQNI